MKKQILIGSVVFSAMVALVLAAQDKYTVKVPGGLAFSEFKGYEDWQDGRSQSHRRLQRNESDPG